MMGYRGDIPVLRINCDGAESLDNSHTRAYTSKDRMLIIQVRRWCQCQEKLRTYCVIRNTDLETTGKSDRWCSVLSLPWQKCLQKKWYVKKLYVAIEASYLHL